MVQMPALLVKACGHLRRSEATASSDAEAVCGWLTQARQSRESTALTASFTNSRQSSARTEKSPSACGGGRLKESASSSRQPIKPGAVEILGRFGSLLE